MPLRILIIIVLLAISTNSLKLVLNSSLTCLTITVEEEDSSKLHIYYHNSYQDILQKGNVRLTITSSSGAVVGDSGQDEDFTHFIEVSLGEDPKGKEYEMCF